MKLLHLDSSALGTGSVTRELTAAIVARWQDKLPHLQVEYRDLDANPLPHLTGRSLAQSDPAEAADAARTMEQFLEADVLVIGAPMYNFSIPGSTPLTRTLQISLIMGQEECHATEKKVQRRVQA